MTTEACHADRQGPCVARCCPIKGKRAPLPCPPSHAQVHACGYPEGSFACRIRHVHLNTGDAKAANN